ncbi:GDSL esterase/lipase LIP-4-like [Salvia miltiorrhiza]|uniref:GDSL esterase/lipase LIP-4-like n=1 Tax=Salvia miltiorrhiza TaxID=226208 RepID=UPI0025ABC429|nr:GDSL esterase/lipase LIP-4-like [Salvia miltiorrhiza]
MYYSSKISLALVCFFFLGFGTATATAAACSNEPLIFNFGDSNSDTGGASVLSGRELEFPEGRTFFHEPTGRASDGRLILDFLCESLETKFLTPYLELFTPDFSNGVNFALGGADSRLGRTDINSVAYTLGNEIAEFSRFRNVTIRRGSLDAGQVKSALFMLDIGQNDIQFDTNTKTLQQVLDGDVPAIVSNIGKAMQMLYQLGGRNFWVHNTGPLGCLPSNVALINASTAVDEYGCVSDKNKAAAAFNSQLERLCRELRLEMGDATIVYVDIYSIKLDLIVNATSYGFENPFVQCKPKGQSVCPEGSRYVNWDGFHYTEAANMLVASKIISTSFSTPPLPFQFFCN